MLHVTCVLLYTWVGIGREERNYLSDTELIYSVMTIGSYLPRQ